ncbi:hypothetical protein EJ06DRAFT_556995 [Trichodelitschia bisporula]|uniref:Uncharacterized protein n=1 Tax=Trichodelitschia bisporula TaxID=703511 RepID=A0A6G1HV70_9PEZI|nr:hypothetical protein EJ06DRAFT_556995 [Trichodelitschia bisporula]
MRVPSVAGFGLVVFAAITGITASNVKVDKRWDTVTVATTVTYIPANCLPQLPTITAAPPPATSGLTLLLPLASTANPGAIGIPPQVTSSAAWVAPVNSWLPPPASVAPPAVVVPPQASVVPAGPVTSAVKSVVSTVVAPLATFKASPTSPKASPSPSKAPPASSKPPPSSSVKPPVTKADSPESSPTASLPPIVTGNALRNFESANMGLGLAVAVLVAVLA